MVAVETLDLLANRIGEIKFKGCVAPFMVPEMDTVAPGVGEEVGRDRVGTFTEPSLGTKLN